MSGGYDVGLGVGLWWGMAGHCSEEGGGRGDAAVDGGGHDEGFDDEFGLKKGC